MTIVDGTAFIKPQLVGETSVLFLLCIPHRFFPLKEFAHHFSLGGNQLLVFHWWEQTQGLLVAFSFWSPTIFSVTALQHQGCYHAITKIHDSSYFCFLSSKIVTSILPLIPSIGPSRRDSDITETDPKIDQYVNSWFYSNILLNCGSR